MALQLAPIVDGPASGDPLFFIQGWPDDASLWDEQVAALRTHYRCLRVNLPNYGGRRDVRWGYSTDQIVEALADSIRSFAGGAPVTLIAHDWGAYWAFVLHHRYPGLVSRLASLDVAPHYRPEDLRAQLLIAGYQSWLIGAFLLGGALGARMTQGMARLAGAPSDLSRVDAWMNYPYRNVWQDLFSGRAREHAGRYWPRAPLLFVYGRRKLVMFHSERWIAHVRSVGGQVVALDTGHWVSKAPEFTSILTQWLDATRAGMARPGTPSGRS